MGETDMQVALLAIGNEILRGDTLDTNSNFLAQELTRRGAVLRRILTIPDELELVAEEISRHALQFAKVITTGGIGPTPDDLTRQAAALAFDRRLVLYEEVAHAWRRRKGSELNAGQLAMCTMPEGARLINTRSTSAPGFIIDNVFAMAGVPAIMKEMWASIADEFSGRLRSVHAFAVHQPESQFAEILNEFQAQHPDLDFGSYPHMEGDWHTDIKVFGHDASKVSAVGIELEKSIRRIGD
jgi:molybdenum cofactor synthesis domain-containing protein